ncbi:MAG: hypothetical protein KatS3mg088_768 [Patescibacteria group bacterium]|nr:MAG: hypothetical protein KatS3mg088_768 [Patescibacteria group bacterium]
MVLFVLNLIFPENVVLGNWRFSAIEAAIYASFWQTFFIWVIWDYLLARGTALKSGVSVWFYFLAVNTVGVWIIARLPHFLGLGIASWLWALVIGILANWLQRIAWSVITKRETK